MANTADVVFLDAGAFFRQSSQHPKEDIFDRLYTSMADVHLLITETLFSAYTNANKASGKDAQDFAEYALHCVSFIEHHHWLEENYVFPALEPEFTCPAIQEHKTFHDSLEGLKDYLLGVLGLEKVGHFETKVSGKDTVPYEPAELKRLMGQLVGPLFIHLKAEVVYLQPEDVRKTGLPAQRIVDMTSVCEKQIDPIVLQKLMGSRWNSYKPEHELSPAAVRE